METPDGMKISAITPAAVISPLFQSMMVVTSPIGEKAPPELAAFTLARDHGMPIRVFNMCKPGALRQVVLGTEEGTTIC